MEPFFVVSGSNWEDRGAITRARLKSNRGKDVRGISDVHYEVGVRFISIGRQSVNRSEFDLQPGGSKLGELISPVVRLVPPIPPKGSPFGGIQKPLDSWPLCLGVLPCISAVREIPVQKKGLVCM